MKVVKKFFKIISIIAVLAVLGTGVFLGYLYLKEVFEEKRLNDERINDSKTLTRYIENHDWDHTKSSEEILEFHAQNIKCDAIDKQEILYYDNGILILKDYSIYETIFMGDKLFSNDQQCKKIEFDVEIENILIIYNTPAILGKDNKTYVIQDNKLTEDDLSYDENSLRGMSLRNKDIVKYIRDSYNDETKQYEVFVIKKDGNLYKQYYSYEFDKKTTKYKYEFIKEEIMLSSEKYGNISDIEYSREIRIDNETQKILNEDIITKIITDKGLYHAKYIETEECEKYEDVECKTEIVLSEIYNKYSDDIKYMNTRYTFTNDNNIIETNILTSELDKEVK